MPTFLACTQRRSSLRNCINSAFDKIKNHHSSQWKFHNGSREYSLCSVKNYDLAKTVIQQAPKTRKDFYFLDIGAGNFQWGDGLADFLNEQTDLPKDIKIHIIGIRGEKNLQASTTDKGQCKIYNFGTFKIENLNEEFLKLGLNLTNKLDLVVTQWCMRHLADGVGTFLQTYNLLQPGGFFLLDGFFFFIRKSID